MEKNKEILLDKFNKIMNNKKKKNKNQIMKELFNEDLQYIEKEEINVKNSIQSPKSRSMPNIFDNENNNKYKKNIGSKEKENDNKEEKKHNEDFDFITNLPNEKNNNHDGNINNEEIYNDFINENNNEK